MSNSNQAPREFINLHLSGLGYLNRVREVSVKKGNNFFACTIKAMFGEKNVDGGIQYLPVDSKATSSQAESILREYMGQANSDDYQVMVAFNVGDPYIETFKYDKGAKAGEVGTTLKGRLILITRVFVKDLRAGQNAKSEMVYEYKPEAKDESESARTGTNG